MLRRFIETTVVLAALLAAGCGSSTAECARGAEASALSSPASAEERALETAAAEAQTRAFVAAKAAQQWGAVWDMMASVHRDIVIAVGKRPAEKDDETARAQGFESAAQVRGLSDRDWFVKRREYLATLSTQVYAEGATMARVEVRPAILVPFPGGRISVYPVRVTLTDGTIDKLGATRERGSWRMLE